MARTRAPIIICTYESIVPFHSFYSARPGEKVYNSQVAYPDHDTETASFDSSYSAVDIYAV